ncbi:uncharacterized protein LOC110441849 [Mizuhopecten yessoensis]|uniref:uncharacterized protein LOC110441849 n=1 Tax=Mizuhopecten yessoensis TaxID=6573 RepID=UPI000B45D814|nr:uncharacterized protein LOC110441849 [Mizuhopecten yessoensis]
MNNIQSKYPCNVILAYININSLRYKFSALSDVLHNSLADILIVGETKLNDSFNQAHFETTGFRVFRKVGTGHGGGLMCFVNSHLPCRRRPDLESTLVESVVVEVTINNPFRPGFGCQSTLLRLVEDWRRALDNHEYVAVILMDLSKALTVFLITCWSGSWRPMA